MANVGDRIANAYVDNYVASMDPDRARNDALINSVTKQNEANTVTSVKAASVSIVEARVRYADVMESYEEMVFMAMQMKLMKVMGISEEDLAPLLMAQAPVPVAKKKKKKVQPRGRHQA